MKEKILLGVITVMLLMTRTVMAQGGFDEYGYNTKARNFVGTCVSWGMGKYGWTETQAEAWCGIYANDKLVMKWNAEWDRGNDENWSNPPYDAWCDNKWNGMAGGSGETWYYMNRWVGDCVNHPELLPEGSYCIWGQFEVTLSHGTYPVEGHVEHLWDAHAIPAGVGP